MKNLLLGLFCLGIGCVPAANQITQNTTIIDHENTILIIDDKFSKSQENIIWESIAEWGDATGSPDTILYPLRSPSPIEQSDSLAGDGINRVYLISQNDITYRKIQQRNNWPVFSGVTTRYKDGSKSISIVLEYLNPVRINGNIVKTDLERLHFLMLHELGHVFGLSHSNKTLMRAISNFKNPCIDQKTLDVFCYNHGNCSGQHSTCEN
jgi:hypothetical protein